MLTVIFTIPVIISKWTEWGISITKYVNISSSMLLSRGGLFGFYYLIVTFWFPLLFISIQLNNSCNFLTSSVFELLLQFLTIYHLLYLFVQPVRLLCQFQIIFGPISRFLKTNNNSFWLLIALILYPSLKRIHPLFIFFWLVCLKCFVLFAFLA